MKHLLVAALGLAAVTAAAVPASAATTYDAFASFNGTTSAGQFSFGSYDGTTYTPFVDGNTCQFANTICLTTGDYLGVYKTADGLPHQSGTLALPDDALVLHPGADGQFSVIFFTVPHDGYYTIAVNAYQADNASLQTVELDGVNGIFDNTFPFAILSPSAPSFSYFQPSTFLPAGFAIGVALGPDGSYFFDSTAVNFTITAVPEPASWALMLTGFGLAGAALRRRRVAAAA